MNRCVRWPRRLSCPHPAPPQVPGTGSPQQLAAVPSFLSQEHLPLLPLSCPKGSVCPRARQTSSRLGRGWPCQAAAERFGASACCPCPSTRDACSRRCRPQSRANHLWGGLCLWIGESVGREEQGSILSKAVEEIPCCTHPPPIRKERKETDAR